MISGVDTSASPASSATVGAMPGAFGPVDGEPGSSTRRALLSAARAEPPTDGRDLVAEVTCTHPYRYGNGPFQVVAYDFGIKRNILRNLATIATVTVVPASTRRTRSSRWQPDGVFLSNGPGDPAAVAGATEAVRGLLGKLPVFGICLGHQILAQALGASTYKLPFGHHGGNHPVRRLATGTVEITSQNHNYAGCGRHLGGTAEVSHVNLNDGVIEGFVCRDVPAFSVQYHPEAGPGPHDARYLFGEFDELMRRCGAKAGSRDRARDRDSGEHRPGWQGRRGQHCLGARTSSRYSSSGPGR